MNGDPSPAAVLRQVLVALLVVVLVGVSSGIIVGQLLAAGVNGLLGNLDLGG